MDDLDQGNLRTGQHRSARESAMKTILLATDFSARSDRALRRATLLARQVGAVLVVVHVVDDDQPPDIVETERAQAETLLRRLGSTLRDVDGVSCETQVILALPFVGILEAVEAHAPDLVVIGSHRRQVLRDVFVGTTAERTIRSADRPVLMVNAPPVGPYTHVLQTTDLSEASRDALRRFADLGLGAGLRNTILHVFDAPALHLALSSAMSVPERERYLAEERDKAAAQLAQFLAAAELGDPHRRLRHESSAAHHEILAAAQEAQADLVVLSTHGRTGMAKLLIGSVTEAVLRTARIDVLAIPPARHD
jgi:nucleotide-binding universal stress UspA family protein